MTESSSRPTVLIADDHAFVLEGLVSLLQDRFEIVGTVNDGNGLVEAAVRLRPDVIVTDISMPGLNGMEALKRLRTTGCAARIIVLTLHADADLAASLISCGASGFVMKLMATSELVTAIDRALEGQIYMTPGLAADTQPPPFPAR